MSKHYISVKNGSLDDDIVTITAISIETGKEVPINEVDSAFVDYSFVEFRLNQLVGKLLTQCDAIFNDSVQRKAVKDIIRNLIAIEFSEYSDVMKRKVMKDSLKEFDDMSDEEFEQFTKKYPPVDISEVIAPGK